MSHIKIAGYMYMYSDICPEMHVAAISCVILCCSLPLMFCIMQRKGLVKFRARGSLVSLN